VKPAADATPHDFRVVCGGFPPPVVVGGQAVNLWALTYLPDIPRNKLVSADLDIVVSADGHARLKRLPKWVYEPNDMRNWTDTRMAFLKSATEDGRPLLVEVLHAVHGLDKADLEASAETELEGVRYRLLDPVAMLKAKAANVRDIPQDDVPPRNDREHLAIIAKCVPLYLADVKQTAEARPDAERAAVDTFMRLYRTLQDPRFLTTLKAEAIAPEYLMPAGLRQSPLERFAKLHAHQWPLVVKTNAQLVAPQGPRQSL